MRICICDDDISIHDEIKLLLQSICDIQSQLNITDCFSGEELIKHYSNDHSFDIIFLDIEMYQLNGIKVAEEIRHITDKAIIIFVSNFPNYVFESFRVDALHFLVKPISVLEFNNVFKRALHKYKILNSTIALKWQGERYIIRINDIKYIEGYKRHITVYTKDGTYEALGKIPDLLEELSPHGFIRTHQGFIVNMDKIKRFDSTDIILFDDTKVMISVRKRAEALQEFDKYLKTRRW